MLEAAMKLDKNAASQRAGNHMLLMERSQGPNTTASNNDILDQMHNLVMETGDAVIRESQRKTVSKRIDQFKRKIEDAEKKALERADNYKLLLERYRGGTITRSKERILEQIIKHHMIASNAVASGNLWKNGASFALESAIVLNTDEELGVPMG